MTTYPKNKVLEAMEAHFIIPIFYNPDLATAISLAEACSKGGAKVIEFTNRGDNALEVFEKLAAHCKENLEGVILGAGSIRDDLSAADFVKAGADFIVGPFFKKEIAVYCQEQDIPYLPGCATPTEIANAEQHGIEICKIFPAAQLGGPALSVLSKPPCQAVN